MASIERIEVPDIGDFDEVDVVEVLVSPGDRIEAEDSLISLESDKATMDVPAPMAGTVQDVKVKAGDKVSQGSLILTLEVEDGEQEDGEEEKEKEKEERQEEADARAERETDEEEEKEGREREEAPEEADRRERTAPVPVRPPVDHADFTRAYASPAVRRLARQLGVDLSRVKGTGRKGRILKEDVQAWVRKTLETERERGGTLGLPEMPVIDFSRFGEVERQPLTRIQKISGPNVHRSWLHVPHVTQHDEADVTEMEAFRRDHAEEAQEEGFKLTPLVFIMKAAVAALKEFPTVNSSLDPDGGQLILKRYYHLGIAVDTPEGLMVPVVRDVDGKSLFDLARELGEVSAQARERKLNPSQLQGASFTISSLGGIGGTAFTPIVNAPEVAILGVSRAYRKPVWREGEFVPRLMLPLSFSYDHRVIDGATAVRFTTHLSRLLGDIRRLLL